MKMYCITISDEHYEKIKNLEYIPVGLGEKITLEKFVTDKTEINISNKNPYYGEYTFHYWLWKNNKVNNKNDWIGFCQYRKFWINKNVKSDFKNLSELNKNLLKEIPSEFNDYESILGEPFFINQFKLMKFMKKNLLKIIKKPILLFDKNKRTIKFHFDLMHGEGNLDKAIKLLDSSDRKDFLDFVNKEVSFNPHNMFICKNYSILEKYYNTVFPWLERCEKEFGFELEGYGLKRIYGFLAERFMSFWFQKYTKYKTLPIVFKDITEID